jgi:hypothetical protein
MKGDIFNMFEDFICETWDDETYEKIYASACPHLKNKDPYVGPGTYADEDLMTLVGVACDTGNVSQSDAVNAFGKYCFPKLLKKMPELTATYVTPKELLLSVEPIIHVEVRKLYKDTELPRFYYEDKSSDTLTMIYQSKRRLYDFVDGMIQGVSTYYQVPISSSLEVIEWQGDEAGKFDLKFG